MGDRLDGPLSKTAPGLGLPDVERRAAIIRDHVVPLVQVRGQGHQYGCAGQSGPLHLTTWECGQFRFVLRVPFGPPGVQGKVVDQHPTAAGRKSNPALLPYGLDIWRRLRVLSVAWEPDGRFEVVGFRRGTWEADTLALSPVTS